MILPHARLEDLNIPVEHVRPQRRISPPTGGGVVCHCQRDKPIGRNSVRVLCTALTRDIRVCGRHVVVEARGTDRYRTRVRTWKVKRWNAMSVDEAIWGFLYPAASRLVSHHHPGPMTHIRAISTSGRLASRVFAEHPPPARGCTAERSCSTLDHLRPLERHHRTSRCSRLTLGDWIGADMTPKAKADCERDEKYTTSGGPKRSQTAVGLGTRASPPAESIASASTGLTQPR